MNNAMNPPFGGQPGQVGAQPMMQRPGYGMPLQQQQQQQQQQPRPYAPPPGGYMSSAAPAPTAPVMTPGGG